MKLVNRYGSIALITAYAKGNTVATTISQAVENECDGSDYDRRSVETANKVAELLGRLVEKLHETGALKDEDVLALLPGYEKAED